MKMNLNTKLKIIIIFIYNLFLFNHTYAQSAFSDSIPKFVINEYDTSVFKISQHIYTHGAVSIEINQVKRINSHKDYPHYCRALVKIYDSSKIIEEIYYDDMMPVGFSFGIFVPPNQNENEYFKILKIGDYDGRLFLISKDGIIFNLPGGFYFTSDNGKYLISEYASDMSEITIFNLTKGQVLMTLDDIPYIHNWYKRNGEYFFTESEWIDKTGRPSEIKNHIYKLDFDNKILNKIIVDPDLINTSLKVKYKFDPREFEDCECIID